jgi:predicted DNA-binding protein (MmcQ/YjbR family)
MDIQSLRKFCMSLPATTEDVKWGHDLCFSIGGKMFCVAGLEPPLTASFKVDEDDFDELSSRDGFEPAPYMARHKWILINSASRATKKEWEQFVKRSYELVSAKLPAATKKKLKID